MLLKIIQRHSELRIKFNIRTTNNYYSTAVQRYTLVIKYFSLNVSILAH